MLNLCRTSESKARAMNLPAKSLQTWQVNVKWLHKSVSTRELRSRERWCTMTVAWSKVSQRLRFTPQQHIRASAQSKSSFGNATTKRQNKQPRGQKSKTKASWRSSLSLPTTRWTTRQKTLRTSPRLLQILSTIQIVTKLWLCPSRSKSSNRWIVVAHAMP